MYIFESYTHSKNSLVLFLGQYDPASKTRLVSEVQNSYEAHLTPELIILVYPDYIYDDVKELLEDEAFLIDLKRQINSPIACIGFDKYGKLSCSMKGFDGGGLAVDFGLLALDLVQSGYEHLMSERKEAVLVKSPSGTVFSKPSGKTLEEFIYASQLARTSCENQFLAMSLLRHAPKDITIDHLYIDTASISAIAEALVYYMSKFNGNKCKHIKYSSFSSYERLDECKPDNTDNIWVTISASASTSMGKKIVKEWNVKPQQVITILSYKKVLLKGDKNEGNAVVFSVDAYSKIDSKVQSPIKVQVQGENFTAEISTPNKILIKKRHKPSSVDKLIHKFNKGNVYAVNRGSRCLYIDYSKFNKKYLSEKSDKGLSKWMKQVSSWAIPKDLKAVIVGDSDDEKLFYEDFKKVLTGSGYSFGIGGVEKFNHDDNKGLSRVGTGAVLILSPVITSGNSFVNINRALRLVDHKGMRIFVTAFVSAPSKSQHERFKKSLTFATNGFSYSFLSYRTMYIGNKSNSTWQAEKEFIRNMLDGCDPKGKGAQYWRDRKDLLGQDGEGLSGHLGLAYGNASDKLKLTTDFAFWPPGYDKNIDLESVYATVASILQNLRDNKVSGDSLASNIYQHSVLDPENFVRFNDSILQSCLWRCATPSELDYRRSDEISNDFQRVLSKIFSGSGSERGDVSLDLLMGIALRWIKLADKALFAVVDDATAHLTKPHAKLLIEEIKRTLDSRKRSKSA